MNKDKKSILGNIFKGSKKCNCGVEIIEETQETKNEENKNRKS